jgi:hypothetical protein
MPAACNAGRAIRSTGVETSASANPALLVSAPADLAVAATRRGVERL